MFDAPAKEKTLYDATWYSDAQSYWDTVTPTVNGMLGGFAHISTIDATTSLSFLGEFVHGLKGRKGVIRKEPRIGKSYACDCGAGIGRVTKEFLLKVPFERVDVVEQSAKFVEQARESYLKREIEEGRIGEIMCAGLQDFVPEEGKYDLIWCQWVLGHLTDDDFIAFFQRCKKGLKLGGIIGIKENNTSKDLVIDEQDSSVTR
ncbi:alpha-N-methyltransferase NTM1 [Jimgerdemannia flammicorona]|uniref:Alpha N-terminal protein methyltransferase 1 n=1 Tax=Jimgerdemannia flammicorona TaxID=994334 RepID=A0A433ATV2_9FUNG|nr:alpha-N-methyltransferase NTM1 [Jimgerdemannia flammicorona]